MLSNYWKNKLEEDKNLESLQKLYKDKVMKYKLSKVSREHHYSTMFKPVTEKLEEVIEPLKESLPTAIEAPPVPAAIEASPIEEHEELTVAPGVTIRELEDDEEPEDFYDTYSPPIWEIRPDEGLDVETLKEYNLRPPSAYQDLSSEEMKDVIRQISTEKAKITKNRKRLDDKFFYKRTT